MAIAEDLLPYRSQALTVWPSDQPTFQLRYLDEYQGTAAPRLNLLCVHGNPTWSFYYRRVVERFSNRYRVVAPDHLGCGRSDKPTEDQFPYTLAAHRDNLIRLIDELELDHIVLLAHDWGGAIGLAAAVERLANIAGVVLLNTAAFPPPYLPLRIAACRWPLIGTPMVRGLNAFARAAVTMAMSEHRLDDDARRGLLAPYDSWDNRVAIDRFVHDIPMQPGHPTYQSLVDLEAALPRFADVPVRLVWGMKDWCFRPECLRRFEKVWPHAITTELPNTGHYVMEDAPEQALAAIESMTNDLTRD